MLSLVEVWKRFVTIGVLYIAIQKKIPSFPSTSQIVQGPLVCKRSCVPLLCMLDELIKTLSKYFFFGGGGFFFTFSKELVPLIDEIIFSSWCIVELDLLSYLSLTSSICKSLS